MPPAWIHIFRARITDHWMGRVSMRSALWVNVVAVNLVLVALSRLIYLPGLYGYDTLVQVRVLVALFPLAVTVTVWQLVGLWRAAGLDPRAVRLRPLIRVIVAACAAGLAVLVLFTSASALDVARSAAGYDGLGDYRLQVVAGDTLQVEGDIGFGLAGRVRERLSAQPAIRRVRLNSIGGRGSEGVLLARVIEQAGVDTEVTRGCFSACSFAFLGGRRRTLTPGALLGFHWKRPGSFITDLELGWHLRALFERAGVDPAFAGHTFQVTIDDLWIPSHAQLRAAGVTTGPDSGI
ncbi:MAG: hypothetical protein OEY97_08955 [Nitrospirota bacterium]|nr:hypothetical protein [Nitrospirota bacterium]